MTQEFIKIDTRKIKIEDFPLNENIKPEESGWYFVHAVDDRFEGEFRFRAWGNDSWWIPLGDGWLSSPMGLYRWIGPVADVCEDEPKMTTD